MLSRHKKEKKHGEQGNTGMGQPNITLDWPNGRLTIANEEPCVPWQKAKRHIGRILPRHINLTDFTWPFCFSVQLRHCRLSFSCSDRCLFDLTARSPCTYFGSRYSPPPSDCSAARRISLVINPSYFCIATFLHRAFGGGCDNC